MDNIIDCRLDSTCKEIYTGIWQHDYGQILRITGVDLPKAVEVQFSLRNKGGDTLTRIGTTVDGVTEVKVPDSFLKNENCTQNYLIYAWIYVTDDTSGNTEYQIIMHVKTRPKPEEPTEEPLPESNIFHETVEAVNASADRAEQALGDVEEIRDNLNLDLSEKITRPDTAKVGQVLAVKGIDESGKPTVFEAEDVKAPTKTSELENDSGFLTEHQDISGKLDKEKLPEAIDDALTQAKESGEFNGKDGAPGEKGEKGDPGEITYVENPYDDMEIKKEIAAKIGYSEVVDNKLLMYADDTKEKLLATLELPSGVEDVKVGGKSIVENGVVTMPYASNTGFGVISIYNGYGLQIINNKMLLKQVSTSDIDKRNDRSFDAVNVINLDYAVKAAMCDGKGAVWTSDEQAAARERMGAYRRDYRLIADITLEQESSKLIVEKDADGKDISLRKAKIFVFSPAPRENSKNNGYVQLNGKGIYYGAIDWKVNEKNSVTVVNIDIFGEIAPTTVEFVPAHNVSISATRTISMSVGNILDYYNEINKITILANFYFDKGTRFIIIGKE